MSASGARSTAQLVEGVVHQDLPSVAQALSLVEDTRPEARSQAVELTAACHALSRGSGHRIGVTGPPGVGKSSLLNRLVQAYRAGGQSVGVLAIDPSSPRSGGALLGDRARMMIDADDPHVFVRSMASGGQLGGLSRAAGAAVDVLSAGYDVVFVETTGVGQSETDVEHVTDSVVLVIQPASGDVLQFIKSGIVEIPDLFVVNKADLGAVASRAVSELKAALRIADRGHDPNAVLSVSAADGAGVDGLVAALRAHREGLQAGGQLLRRRCEKTAQWALRLLERDSWQRRLSDLGGTTAVLARLQAAADAGQSAIEAVSAIAAD
ncbi:MAG TPA: methylmalonyl Co-A mutase-associated GTPase MeaB [Polyangiaceae bacterium]|nr:methylmalonyl Co-A mutase-associated GTPase MeaB [Polyangiaceae bacterium]